MAENNEANKVEQAAEEFKKEVERLLNRLCFDTFTNTPDYILAEHLTDCLLAYGSSVKKRDAWHG